MNYPLYPTISHCYLPHNGHFGLGRCQVDELRHAGQLSTWDSVGPWFSLFVIKQGGDILGYVIYIYPVELDLTFIHQIHPSYLFASGNLT